MIQTSICIGKLHKEQLSSAAKRMNISVNELITILLQRSRKLFSDKPELFHTVRYQRFSDEQFIIMHMEIPEVDYEYATAMRYVFKISVSFIVRMGIDLLIPELLNETLKGKDYVATNFFKARIAIRDYSINHFISISREHWKLNWDLWKERI